MSFTVRGQTDERPTLRVYAFTESPGMSGLPLQPIFQALQRPPTSTLPVGAKYYSVSFFGRIVAQRRLWLRQLQTGNDGGTSAGVEMGTD